MKLHEAASKSGPDSSCEKSSCLDRYGNANKAITQLLGIASALTGCGHVVECDYEDRRPSNRSSMAATQKTLTTLLLKGATTQLKGFGHYRPFSPIFTRFQYNRHFGEKMYPLFNIHILMQTSSAIYLHPHPSGGV